MRRVPENRVAQLRRSLPWRVQLAELCWNIIDVLGMVGRDILRHNGVELDRKLAGHLVPLRRQGRLVVVLQGRGASTVKGYGKVRRVRQMCCWLTCWDEGQGGAIVAAGRSDRGGAPRERYARPTARAVARGCSGPGASPAPCLARRLSVGKQLSRDTSKGSLPKLPCWLGGRRTTQPQTTTRGWNPVL